ncbi:MAG: metal ABC transporter permease [Parachlamydiales bacterium]
MTLLLMTLFAGLLASIAGGLVGSYVVVKRIAFISGSIAHAVLSGMGLFLWLNRRFGIEWVTPLEGAVLAAILSALIIGWARLRYRDREDSIIAAVWALGMAVGILFVSLTPGYNVELLSFLLGNILWVAPKDLLILGGLDLIVLIICGLLHPKLLALCFDEQQARLQGIAVSRLYLLLLVLVALTVVLLVQMVGIVLVITMLILPPTIAGLFTTRLSAMMGLAVILGVLFSAAGIGLSFLLDWPTGATIALCAGLVYLFSLPLQKRA